MAIGPVQLLVLGFPHPDLQGEVIAELERVRETDMVRVIDALAVHKDASGAVEVLRLGNLTAEETIELGSKVGALVGLGLDGEAGIEEGARIGAQEAAKDGVRVFSTAGARDLVARMPDDSAAALILLEHHWEVPLRDAVARAGGFRIDDSYISPLDLVAVGLLAAAEADRMLAFDSPAGVYATPADRADPGAAATTEAGVRTDRR